jgi:hypothetical protein
VDWTGAGVGKLLGLGEGVGGGRYVPDRHCGERSNTVQRSEREVMMLKGFYIYSRERIVTRKSNL